MLSIKYMLVCAIVLEVIALPSCSPQPLSTSTFISTTPGTAALTTTLPALSIISSALTSTISSITPTLSPFPPTPTPFPAILTKRAFIVLYFTHGDGGLEVSDSLRGIASAINPEFILYEDGQLLVGSWKGWFSEYWLPPQEMCALYFKLKQTDARLRQTPTPEPVGMGGARTLFTGKWEPGRDPQIFRERSFCTVPV